MNSLKADPAANASFFSALDEAPMTWRHYAYWLLASGGAFLDGFTVVALGVALPLMKHDLDLSPILIGLIGSALVLGAAISAWLGGLLADKLGRKRMMIINMAVIAIAALLGALAPSPWIVVAAQFLTGVGVGSDFPTSATYVSEMTPTKTRNRMTVATIAMQSVGMVTSALVSLAVLSVLWNVNDWRLLLGAGGAIALMFLMARLFAPESVRWLVSKGRFAEAKALLKELAIEFHEQPPREAITAAPPSKEKPREVSRQSTPGASISTLFSARYRLRLLLACLPWLLMDVATYGVGLFTPVILGAMHFGRAGAGPVAADFADAKGSALVDLFLLIGFVTSLWAVPRFGRIPMQIVGFGGMSIGMTLLLFAAVSGHGAHAHIMVVIGGFVLFNFAMNAGPNATTFTLAPTLFPTAVRASASGLAAASAKVGATFGTFAVPQLHAIWGLKGVVGVMVFVSVAGVIATAGLAHEVNEEGVLEE